MRSNLNGDYPAIDPGSFRHPITLLTRVLDTDDSGSVVTYQPAVPPVTAWASVDYQRGSEVLANSQDITLTYIKVTMWYRPEFTAQSRIQIPSGQQFIVQYIENVKLMNTYLILTCEAIG